MFKRYRKATWALILWSVLSTYWLVSGLATTHCKGSQACEAGASVGVAVILVVGFCGFIALSLIWIMSKPQEHAQQPTR